MKHTHDFVESYDGLLGFGMDRETDENTVICYLQKISDDELVKKLVKRMTDEELEEMFEKITNLMREHFKEREYHKLFLKD